MDINKTGLEAVLRTKNMPPLSPPNNQSAKTRFNPKRLINYFKESKDELKKVIWPSRKEAVKHTLIVIGVSLAVAIFLGAIDYLMNFGLSELIQ